MSNRASKEIECLNRLEVLTPTYGSVLDFLHAEDLISKEERKGCIQTQDQGKWLWSKLSSLSKTNKIQLLEYNWEILPVERIKIIVVTDRNNKEFSFNH
jgi:hypothetical protein